MEKIAFVKTYKGVSFRRIKCLICSKVTPLLGFADFRVRLGKKTTECCIIPANLNFLIILSIRGYKIKKKS